MELIKSGRIYDLHRNAVFYLQISACDSNLKKAVVNRLKHYGLDFKPTGDLSPDKLQSLGVIDEMWRKGKMSYLITTENDFTKPLF